MSALTIGALLILIGVVLGDALLDRYLRRARVEAIMRDIKEASVKR